MNNLLLIGGLALAMVCNESCIEIAFGKEPIATPLTATADKSGAEVTTIVHWQVTVELGVLCELTTKRDPIGKLSPEQHVTFYRENGKQRQKLFEYTTVFRPLNIYQLGRPAGRLLTIWTGGSAYPYHFQIFAFVDGKIVSVLAIDSTRMPEILMDKNNREIILATEENRTHIYKWDGVQYTFLKTVPWESRLDFVQDYVIAKELDLSTPQPILRAVKERGADSVVRKLTMNWDDWNKVLERIGSGAAPWLEVARALRPGTDAFATTTLEMTVAGALPKSPKYVLQLIGSGFALEDVCSIPQLEVTKAEALQYLEDAESALEKSVGSELEMLRHECLTRLRKLQAKYREQRE